MNIHEVLKGIKDGSIVIETKGHGLSPTGSFNRAIERLKETAIRRLEHEIDFWNVKVHDTDIEEKSIKAHLKSMESDSWANKGSTLGIMGIEYECPNCAAMLYICIKDDSTLTLKSPQVVWEKYPDAPCRFSQELVPTETTGIEFKTGKVVFVNHFGHFPEHPEGKKYSRGYSLNHLIGRINIASYLGERGIGYGQVGNTTVGVLVAKDKKSILICEGYIFEEELDDENEVQEIQDISKNYDYVGNVCLDVWRWMCADKQTVDDNKLKLNNDSEYKGEDIVWVNVEPGQWKSTHYYDIMTRDNQSVIISKLELVK